jgi:hypothetical protein
MGTKCGKTIGKDITFLRGLAVPPHHLPTTALWKGKSVSREKDTTLQILRLHNREFYLLHKSIMMNSKV